MKRLLFLVCMALLSLMSEQVFAQQGIGTLQPDKSAALEVVSTKRGMLIPRIDIPDLNQAAPVTNPAHSLLAFNTGASGTQEGFYYWSDDGTQTGVGSWILFSSSGSSVGDIDVLGGDNIYVTETTTGNTTAFEVNLEPGTTDGQLLVTVVDDTDPLNPIISAVWQDMPAISSDLLEGVNAIRLEPQIDANAIPTGVTLVKLGGVLMEATEIRTGWDDDLNQADVTHTLSITGLETVAVENKILVVENDGTEDGVLRTLDRSLSQTISTSQSIEQLTGYSAYTQEVNLSVDVTSLSSDVDITLPNPSLTEGQVITIRITDTSSSGEPDAYLNIYENNGTTLLTYGALPFQAWVLKSNGANWALAGRY